MRLGCGVARGGRVAPPTQDSLCSHWLCRGQQDSLCSHWLCQGQQDSLCSHWLCRGQQDPCALIGSAGDSRIPLLSLALPGTAGLPVLSLALTGTAGLPVLWLFLLQASRKAGTQSKAAAKRAQRGSSNVFSMFEQSQIQEFKEAFSCIDQNRDGIITKSDLKETYSQLGKVNVKDEELDEMLKEGKGPINFTVFLALFGEKLNGTDPEESILNAFKLFDPNGTGHVNKDEFKQLLLTQADKFTPEEVEQMFAVTPIDVAGNIDYKSLCYIITHGDEKED
nr:myosin regulatory light chain 2, atrial isoform [Pelodiscus sinensis]|eukprot:XP_025041844.1 myosin regulatory light chain 2, atrial isoform [Pelodiscus sinensis]